MSLKGTVARTREGYAWEQLHCVSQATAQLTAALRLIVEAQTNLDIAKAQTAVDEIGGAHALIKRALDLAYARVQELTK